MEEQQRSIRHGAAIYLECTNIWRSDANTGIPRVVRNIIRNAPVVARQHGMDVAAVIVDDGILKIVEIDDVLDAKKSKQVAVGHVKAQLWDWYQRSRDAVSAILGSGALSRFVNAPPTQFGLSRFLLSPLIIFRRLRGAVRSQRENCARRDQRADHSGDILLLLDCSWHYDVWTAATKFQHAGGKVVGLIYDIIPVTHPSMFRSDVAVPFKAWLHKQLSISDGIIAISRYTQQQIQEYAGRRGMDRWSGPSAPITHFYLGSDLDLVSQQHSASADLDRVLATPNTVFLMVGSIEPRKMHAFVLDAFEQLWRRGRRARLVIVGRQGWKTEALLQRIAKHSRLGTDLHLLRNATDDDLAECYRRADVLIMASQVEGFGLPIVEGLHWGLKVLCSDIPVFREVGNGHASYFRLDDVSTLVRLLESYCTLGHKPERKVSVTGRSWRESTEMMFDALNDIVGLPATAVARITATVAE